MCRKMTCLIAFVLVLSIVGNASTELMAYWRFDEGSGDVVNDSSGNGNNGTIYNAEWGVGQYGQALHFNGQDSYVEVPTSENLEIDTTVTIAAWINWIDAGDTWLGIMANGQQNGPWENYGLFVNRGGRYLYYTLSLDGGHVTQRTPDNTIAPDEWLHACATWDGSNARIYVNAEMALEQAQSGTLVPPRLPLRIGHRTGSVHYYNGIIDEVRIYNQALLEDEILAAMEGGVGYPYALGPGPKDGALLEDTWVTLSWTAGDFAVSHDVYLGDDYDAVSNATPDSDVFQGNQVATFYVAGFPGFAYPDGLVPGTTYYWRIDEVNDADPNSPWKGDVWSFSVPPKTAYNPDPPDGAELVDPNDPTLSWTAGFGAKLHTVYFGNDYDEVNNATGGVPAGITIYKPGPLEREKVYYWRVDEFDAVATYKGDVWSFTTPGAVGNPMPSYGATDVGMNATLSWTPSDSAASHELYFGTDKETVRNADAGSPEYQGSKALDVASHDPGLLEADTTYYWRVDEVDDQGKTAKGPLWIFTTGAFLLIDDFEGYTDDDAAGEAIWQTWIDGFGVPDNGAQVGYLLPSYAEQTIVHGGSQSMPLLYANDVGVTNSEASMTLSATRDWTQASVSELSLWLRGASGNAAEPLYVALSNSAGAVAIVAYDDPSAATIRTWIQWLFPLQTFADQGIDLTNVDKMAIGLGSQAGVPAPGGRGTIYVDDIRLCQP